MTVRVQSDVFDAGAELNAFSANRTDAGAIVSFTGVVRDTAGDLHQMDIEHYPAMTAPAIDAIVARARARWDLADTLAIHRYGVLKPGDVIMMVATAAAHRKAAFEAADFLMDYLKSRAPFWKKETTDGGATWVAAKDADEDALSRW